MSGKASGKNVVVVDVRLLCDIESLHFEVAKNYIHKVTGETIPISGMTHLRKYGLEAGTKRLLELFGFSDATLLKTAVEAIVAEFHRYSIVMKPRLLAHGLVEELFAEKIHVVAYSNYEEEINSFLESHISPLYQDIAILPIYELSSFVETTLGSDKPCTIITSEDLSDVLSECLLKSIIRL